MTITEITAMITGFRTATEIVKGISQINKDVTINEKVIQLQNVILFLQSGMMSLQAEHSEIMEAKRILEGQLAKLTGWEDTKAKYHLKQIASGVFVYSLKADAKTGEPPHWLCPKCFNEGSKQILQHTLQSNAGRYYECPKCKIEICDGSKNQNIVVETHNPFAEYY